MDACEQIRFPLRRGGGCDAELQGASSGSFAFERGSQVSRAVDYARNIKRPTLNSACDKIGIHSPESVIGVGNI